MLRGCARLLRQGCATAHLSARLQAPQSRQRFSSEARPCHHNSQQRDYALPNASWSRTTLELYHRFLEGSKDGTWTRIPSYNATVHHIYGSPPADRQTRLFTRSLDEDGAGFEYSMFYNKAEKRMICIFQPGPYLEGPPGYTHGGCIATIIDSTAGAGAVIHCGAVLTANLNVNYKNPIHLGSTVIVDSHIEKIEGRKVYSRCQVRSHDDQILHNEATGLFIKLDPGQAEQSTG